MIGSGKFTNGASGGYSDVLCPICAHVGFLFFISIIIFVMCGFAGVVTWDDRYRVSSETLAKMSAAVAHRGPDGEGAYINHQEQVTADRPQVAMAFRRLAVLDPDPRSNQPVTDGRFWLVFNGEIYNFRELRKELSGLRPEYQWRTTGDTEVLLCAFAVWGEKCVEHLNGMFAFVVWDEREKSLFLARDRMGQKPLYVASDGDEHVVAFASEIGALRALQWHRQLEHPWYCDILITGIEDYLRWGYIPKGRTPFHYIREGRPGSYTASPGREDSSRDYFSVNELSQYRNSNDPVVETRRMVFQAVDRQLVSDVPLGVFLSGGVDSSIVAACARRAGPIQTFSLGFDDPRFDESTYATLISQHLGTEHHVFRITPKAVADLPRLAAVFGIPFADSSALPTYYLAKHTRDFVKVALSGDGGDELFGGYDRYRAMRLAEKVRALPQMARSIVRTGISKLPGTHPKSLGTRLKRLGIAFDLPAGDRYSHIMRIFDETTVGELTGLPKPEFDELADRFDDLVHDGRDVVQAALALDRETYLPGDLLTKVDRCSMMHALEVRSPFMDHELVQFAAGLTTDQLLKGGPKRMLREAFAADLPAWVFKRKKMGFTVPIGEWFRGELRPMLRDSLFAADSFASQNFNKTVVQRLVDEHEQQRVDHSQRLYALLMLELWWNTVKKR
jgi:asparagine synthase (glutamine-hydrolysing)